MLLDGLDLRKWRLKSLRRAVGLVPQETLLFHDTLGANLRMAKPRATDEELEEALGIVEMGDFLATLPEGLSTIVGEQGFRHRGSCGLRARAWARS